MKPTVALLMTAVVTLTGCGQKVGASTHSVKEVRGWVEAELHAGSSGTDIESFIKTHEMGSANFDGNYDGGSQGRYFGLLKISDFHSIQLIVHTNSSKTFISADVMDIYTGP